MQSFTQQEIAWVAKEIAKSAELLKHAGETADSTKVERGLYRLRSEQFQGIADRLASAVANGDKRIAIR